MLLERKVQKRCRSRNANRVFQFLSAEAGRGAAFPVDRDRAVLQADRHIFQRQDALNVQNVIHIIGHAVRRIGVGYAERHGIAVGTAGQQCFQQAAAGHFIAGERFFVDDTAVPRGTLAGINCAASSFLRFDPDTERVGRVQHIQRIFMGLLVKRCVHFQIAARCLLCCVTKVKDLQPVLLLDRYLNDLVAAKRKGLFRVVIGTLRRNI